MRRVWIIACLISFGTTLSAWGMDFSISDYIPQHFEDFMWKVSASTDMFSSDYSNRQERSGISQQHPNDNYVSETDNRNFYQCRFNNAIVYQYVTIPKFFIASNFLTLDGRRHTGSSTNKNATPYGNDITKEESKEDKLQFSIEQNFRGGTYLVKDFFLSGKGGVAFNYHETPVKSRSEDIESYRFSSPDTYRRTTHTTKETPSDSRDWHLNAEFTPGWGRVYIGAFASTAMYMIEELRSNGLLKRSPTKEEMRTLCDMIYQYRQKHVIDERLRRIEALTAIMEYLQHTGVIDDLGPYGYFVIQDVWDYFPTPHYTVPLNERFSSADLPSASMYRFQVYLHPHFARYSGELRQFGTIFQGGIGAEYTYNNTQSSFQKETDYRETRYQSDSTYVSSGSVHRHHYNYDKRTANSIYLTLLGEYHKPVSRQIQIDINALGRYYVYTKETTKDMHIEYFDPVVQGKAIFTTETNSRGSQHYLAALSSSALYLLNSRTSLLFQTDYVYTHIKYEREQTPPPGLDYLSNSASFTTDILKESFFSLHGAAVYRITIPTTLSLSFGYSHSYRKVANLMPQETSTSAYRVALGISHYLF